MVPTVQCAGLLIRTQIAHSEISQWFPDVWVQVSLVGVIWEM